MNVQFYKIAEEVKNLDLVDKVFLKELFEKWIIEEKRELIKKHALRQNKKKLLNNEPDLTSKCRF